MTSGPEYIAERSVWWEDGMKAMIKRLHFSEPFSIAESSGG